MISFFWQGLIFGFGQKGQHGEADQQDEADPHAGGAEALDITAEPFGNLADRKRRGGGEEAADIISEAGARAAQAGREKLGEIDGVNPKDGELAKPHDGQHPVKIAELAHEFENQQRRQKR